MKTPTCCTGIEGLDQILRGGLPKNRLYLIQGDPGVGKTTLALQFLLSGVAAGENCLYITLSETKDELTGVAESHHWSLEKLAILELSAMEQQLAQSAQNTLFHPSDIELNKTTATLFNEVDRVKPTRLVLDSLSELRLLAESPLRYRRQMLALKQFFAGRNCTVLLLDDQMTSTAADQQVQSIAHGVLTLNKQNSDFGAQRRRITIDKLRGVKFHEGAHDYIIDTGGLQVFPRLVAAEHHKTFTAEPVTSGLKELDLLLGGGLDRGTSNLILGPAGTGKSAIAHQFAVHAAERGEKCLLFVFDENIKTILRRTESLGLPLQRYVTSGVIKLRQIDPADVSPGEFAHNIKRAVMQDDVRVVVLDSLIGYLQAMADERFLSLQLHELLTFLSQQGVVTIITVTQHGLIGTMQTPIDVTYLADCVILMRFFEADGEVKKAISVIKKRSGGHEKAIRELMIDRQGLQVGEPLRKFHGVLTGVPTLTGDVQQMLKSR
ncbi:MAG TPA: ATPase domain-containing protein [Verrucomicrobiae bacterium]|nr:ATPase domain-containing protein [Verrucomicrobiae bacterium]